MKILTNVCFCILIQLKILAQAVIPVSDCKGSPYFFNKLCTETGKKYYFSTAEKYRLGFYCMENSNNKKDKPYKYQHNSWNIAGSLGAFVIDPLGDIYLIPTPYINNYYNPPNKQNIIYRIDNRTGIMDSVFDLRILVTPNEKNPYGLMGITFDCERNNLIVSTITGSSINKPNGIIFILKLQSDRTLKVIETKTGIDALSLCIVRIKGKKKLFFGEASSNLIKSIEINDQDLFDQKIVTECNLNDPKFLYSYKANKIRFNQKNQMIVSGTLFDYTFSIPGTEKPTQITYMFINDSWKLDYSDLN